MAATHTRRQPVQRALQWLVLGTPVAAFVGAGWAHRWITDDGFIYLRVFQQIRHGNGPVFNAGQRVEAFTGPLWLAVLTVADFVTPIRLEWLAVGLGLIASAFGLMMAIAGASRLARTGTSDAFLIPFGVLIFVALPPAWVFGMSGLETGLSFAWLGVSLWLLVGWAQSRSRMTTVRAVVLGLGWLVRPELILFSAAFLVIVLGMQWREDRWRDRARLVAAMIALPLAYQVFRMGFYGSLVTNTAIAKEGTSTNWERGWDYLRDFADPYWLWVPGVLLVVGGYAPLALVLHHRGERRALFVIASFLLAGLLHAVYVVAVADYIHGRLFLPPAFALCAPVAVIAATRRHLAALLLAPWALAAVLFLRPPQVDRRFPAVSGIFFPRAASGGAVTTDDWAWGANSPRSKLSNARGFYLEVPFQFYRRMDVPLKHTVDLPAVALFTVGLRGYALGRDFNIVDVFGLADPLGSHFTSTPNT
jgi:arabinofuranosyltransferase